MIPLVIGIAFGILLDQGGLTRHEKIVGVFRLRDFTLLKFLGAALVVGSLSVQAALSLQLVSAVPVTPTRFLAQAIGGALFGAAMALSGFCPGTIVAGAGTGRLDALIPGIGGLYAGALVMRRFTLPSGNPATLPGSHWLWIALLCELALIGFYFLEKGERQ
jgi:uncharacterized protein